MPLFGTLFTIPTDALTQIGSTTSTVFTDLFGLVTLIGGIFIGLGIVFSIIRILRPRS